MDETGKKKCTLMVVCVDDRMCENGREKERKPEKELSQSEKIGANECKSDREKIYCRRTASATHTHTFESCTGRARKHDDQQIISQIQAVR